MARGDIKVPIAVDTGPSEKAIRNGLIDPIDDAEEALDRLSKADTGDLDRQMQRAQQATEEFDDDLDEARRGLDKLRFAAQDAGDVGATSMDRIKGGARELQAEFGQNLGQAVSSFRGDLSDLGQTGQDTLGGLAALAAMSGPAGLVGAFALAAGAAGLGAIVGAQEEAKERQQELNELAGRFADGFMESAGRYMSTAAVLTEYQRIATDPEKYQDAEKAAEQWGVTTSTAMLALAGDSTALGMAQQGLADRTAVANENLSEAEQRTGQLGDAFSSLPEDIRAGQERLDNINTAMDTGRQQALDFAAGLYDMATRVGEATGETDDLGNAIVRLPDGKEVVVSAETQQASYNLDAIENRQLPEKVMNVRVGEIDDSRLRIWRDNWTQVDVRASVRVATLQ